MNMHKYTYTNINAYKIYSYIHTDILTYIHTYTNTHKRT